MQIDRRVVTDGTVALTVAGEVGTHIDTLTRQRVLHIQSKELARAVEYLRQPEVAKAPSLDSVVRGWVR